MKDDKSSKSELNYRNLTQSDKDLVAKLVKGGFSRREVLKLIHGYRRIVGSRGTPVVRRQGCHCGDTQERW